MDKYMLTPEALRKIIQSILDGELFVPQYQRRYVWDSTMAARLLEDLIDGNYLGSFVAIESKTMESTAQFGYYNIPSAQSCEKRKSVVDGHQRLATLLSFQDKLDPPHPYRFYYCLNSKKNCPKVVYLNIHSKQVNSKTHIPLSCMLNDISFKQHINLLEPNYVDTILKVRERVLATKLHFIYINSEVDRPQDIFLSINERGCKLTDSDLLKASIVRIDQFIDKLVSKLALNDWHEYQELLRNKDVMRDCIIGYVYGRLNQKKYWELSDCKYDEYLDEIYNGFCSAIDFLIKELNVTEFRFIPHTHYIVPLIKFFGSTKAKGRTCDNYEQVKLLKAWFWKRNFTLAYKYKYRSWVQNDIEFMMFLRQGCYDKIDLDNVSLTCDFFLDHTYGDNYASRVFQLMLISRHPLSFLSGTSVDYIKTLSKAASGIAHHVYPKRPLQIFEFSSRRINALVNHAIINEQDNDTIKDKLPSTYGCLMHNGKRYDILSSALCPEMILRPDYLFDEFERDRSKLLVDYANRLMTGEI